MSGLISYVNPEEVEILFSVRLSIGVLARISSNALFAVGPIRLRIPVSGN